MQYQMDHAKDAESEPAVVVHPGYLVKGEGTVYLEHVHEDGGELYEAGDEAQEEGYSHGNIDQVVEVYPFHRVHPCTEGGIAFIPTFYMAYSLKSQYPFRSESTY